MDKELTLDDYDIMKTLGQGQFGKVYKVKRKGDRPEDPPIALKVIDIEPRQQNIIDNTENEVKRLKELSNPDCNPFVICYYNSYHYDTEKYEEPITRFLIEMELVDGVEMDEYVKKLWREKSEEMVYYYLLLIAKDILQGLAYTHDNNIIHNDIKLENIMIDKNNIPRIVDYGLACTMNGSLDLDKLYTKYCKSNGGTPDYVPPEFLNQRTRLPASDLWALGIGLYIAATKNGYPYDIDEYTGIEEVFTKIQDDIPAKLNTSNDQLNSLVNGLLTKDPANRLTVEEGLELLDNIPKPGSRVPAPEITATSIQTEIGSFQDMQPTKRQMMSSFILM